jgi:hypothetical protein
MKITKSELKGIIREEAQKFKRKIELEKELKSLQEQIEEVRAAGTREIPGGGGHGYGKDFETKSRAGGPEALVEDEFDEFSFEDEMGEEPIMSKDELGMGSMHSEEDIDIDAILAEIMNEDSHTEEEEEEHFDEGIAEMQGMDECGTMDEMQYMNESKRTNKKVISEEISRMQKLAGIKKVM